MPDKELTLHLEFPMVRATFAGEEVEAPFSFDLENNILLQLLDNLNDYGPSFRERLLIPMGQQLFEALLPPPVLSLYLRARASLLTREGERLPIRIVADTERFLTIPWEFIYDTRHGVFPATALETPVLRTLGRVQEGQALQPRAPIRLLIAGACPIEEPELDYEQEFIAIERAVGDADVSIRVLRDATFSSLGSVLKDFRPHMLHLVAHGYCDNNGCGVRLDDGEGNTHLVYAGRIADWFTAWKPDLVFLNACESGRVHPEAVQGGLPVVLARKGIHAVVAMQYRVPDEAAVLFTKRFYETLFQGMGLVEAVQVGRHALLASNGLIQRHFATPVLYLGRRAGGRIVDIVSPRPKKAAGPRIRVSPFKYLDAFGRDEKAMFFGRGKAIEQVVTLIATHRLTIIHGVSGVGKTSLVHAGLAQSIADGLYHAISLRAVTDPIRSLDRAVGALIEQNLPDPGKPGTVSGETALHRQSRKTLPPAPGPGAPITERLRYLQTLSHKTTLIILDQFEEVITVLDEHARQRLLELLERLYGDPALRLRLVLVVRDDFLGALGTFSRWLPTILANRYRLDPLSAEAAREAIEGPLSLVGCPYERELVVRLIEDLGGSEVDPASLQIAGHLLFEAAKEQGAGGLTLSLYERLHGVQGLMERHLGRLEEGLSTAEKSTLYRILQVFVGQYGTRRPVGTQTLIREVGTRDETLSRWIEHLERHRIIRPVEGVSGDEAREQEPHWELSHDVLAKAIARRAELLGFRREVARLTLKTRALSSLTVLLSLVILAIAATYLGSRYGIVYRVVAPHDGKWEYRLWPGQEACARFSGSPEAGVKEGRFQGRECTFWALPIGTYEFSLKEVDQENTDTIRFPIEVRPMMVATQRLPPKPIIRFHGHEMVYIPGATVTLGDSKLWVDIVPSDQEKTVTLKPFYLDRHEVTLAQYRAFLQSRWASDAGALDRIQCLYAKEGNTPRPRPDLRIPQPVPGVPPSREPELPVVFVTADEAMAYAEWLTDQSRGQYRFRLPASSEWELAARGLDAREFPWGDCFAYEPWANLMDSGTDDNFANRAPVGSFPDWHSPFGLLDMAGNVSELTRSCAPPPDGPPRSPECWPVVRGANFTRAWFDAIAAWKRRVSATLCSDVLGFRLAMDVPAGSSDPKAP